MNLKEMRKLASTLTMRDKEFVNRAKEAKRYFKNENDIKDKGQIRDATGLRSADNRVPANFLYILITSKASYLATNEITFDVGNDQQNKLIQETLGEKWVQTVYELIVLASIAGCAYIHFWVDGDGKFQYAPIEAQYVMPLESNGLIKDLMGVVYQHKIIQDGEFKQELDYFNDTSVFFYINPNDRGNTYDYLEEYYPWLDYKEQLPDVHNEMRHNMGEVPFIKFKNNYYETSDLSPVKGLIDAYDKVLSGYINDLEDIQQVFMTLKGYEGEDLDEFREFLMKYKIIKLESDDEIQGDIDIKNIQIPYEARNSLLDLLRKRIFEDGQGIDPDPQNFGNSSGVALKHLYDNLELKSSQVEMYFRPAFEKLIRAICRYHGFTPAYINQTWTRNIPVDEEATVNMVRNLNGLLSERDLLALLPFVDDPDGAIERLNEERRESTNGDEF